MKRETRATIMEQLFKRLGQDIDSLTKEYTGEYDDCAADYYVHDIERTAKAILDFMRTIHKDNI